LDRLGWLVEQASEAQARLARRYPPARAAVLGGNAREGCAILAEVLRASEQLGRARSLLANVVAADPAAGEETITEALLHELGAPPVGPTGDRLDAAIAGLLQESGIDGEAVLGRDVAGALLECVRWRLGAEG